MKKIFSFVALQIFSFSLSFGQINLTSGLVAHYTFTGNALDVSGNGKNGTNSGATLTNDRNANANSAYNFNGTNAYISIPGTIITPAISAVTFCAWVRKDPTWNINGDVKVIYFGTDQGEMQLFLYGEANATSSACFAVRLSNETWYGLDLKHLLANNQDYFIVGTYTKGQNIKLYVNGILIGQRTIPNANLDSGPETASSIGSYNRNAQPSYGYFKGVIDDVKVYNRALNTQEINALNCTYNSVAVVGSTTTNQTAIQYINAPPTSPSGQTNIINAASNVTYRAGKAINLNAGFRANQGAIFKAEIGGCL
jgi:trimeric autotransporter adhesin